MVCIFDLTNSPTAGVEVGFESSISYVCNTVACNNNTSFGCDYDNDPIDSSMVICMYHYLIAFKTSSFMPTMTSYLDYCKLAYLSISSLADYGSYQHYLFRI